ncbi:unnamed protein product [Hydatigera taeniaeformis]|uniref:Inositol-pentakisphosphate 2-kinase n=1 Tax=Hydatigena taeniaeformis TaxID=6205 RepID=A0A0R3WML2_HYDTA|nr:unnamed protein product [Hydatigera taeniaeformis]
MLHLNNLRYRGEGNNNIVLADGNGMVYRVRKVSPPALLPTKNTRALKKNRQPTVLFGQHRMAQYFGPDFVQPFQLIDVDPSILQAINDRFQSSRPVFRLNRGIDLQTTRVLAAPDATCIPAELVPYGEGSVLCVEIKPKFGAIPLGPERDSFEATVRRNAMFCIMQYDEKKRRMWGQPSSYCPCDLFSGYNCLLFSQTTSYRLNQDRMLRALLAMFEVRQNNLRVFRNSCCVLNNTIDLLDNALMDFFYPSLSGCEGRGENYNSSGNSSEVIPSHAPEEFSSDGDCDSETTYHLRGCQLHPAGEGSLRHRFVQGLLLPALLTETPSSSVPRSIRRSSKFRYDCDLHPYTPSTSSNGVDALATTDSYIAGKIVVNTAEVPPCLIESLNLVEKHLVAMVARDCSIMLTFQRAKDNCLTNLLAVGGACPCVPRSIVNISIVDLDPKELNNLQERVEAERRVVEQFLIRREG